MTQTNEVSNHGLPRNGTDTASVAAWQESVLAMTNYLPTACHTCKQYSMKLSRCSGCKIYSYCTSDHQVAHWAEHKTFCKGIQFLQKHNLVPLADVPLIDVAETPVDPHTQSRTGNSPHESQGEASPPPRTEAEWCALRFKLAGAMEVYLKRPLLLHEHQACMFMNHCENCLRTYAHKVEANSDSTPPGARADLRSLTKCAECESVSYCSDSCRETSSSHHQRWCSEYVLLMELERVVAEKGLPPPWIPDLLVEKSEGPFVLPTNFEEYLQTREFPAGIFTPSLLTLSHVYSSQAMTYPLTILWALQRLASVANKADALVEPYQPTKSSLVLHLVGANAHSEALHSVKYEELLHLLPTVTSLTVVLIGPHAPTWTDSDDTECDMCDSCLSRSRHFRLRYRRMEYNKFIESEGTVEFGKPDIIVAYNCGFHEYTGKEEDSWNRAMPYMLKKDVPLIATSYTKSESVADTEYIQAHGGHVSVASEKNPFFGRQPFRDWKRDDDCDFYYYNNYVAVFSGDN
ncbi:hypothetical protein SARC_05036 [Sphaeroforma arctica JP610]|uniref:MYND-type domain-containing protein n=1 Tax=Sphaeroforma arctica JP610 TaxID=667725 RepID=A0A0L0G0P4_9EUKA|nr:hypothetical protein SARC_05036 [Sphaeroforma arctica JP610]KNC82677.1 hypothetical protein SARC_05036 [Sphaeroforma arctica JP610]|eukprot:XP_014156579.1 hypothetical protein SARC_05036 [Sphaeroforma arctica JP610]